jgi:hypothetical protein
VALPIGARPTAGCPSHRRQLAALHSSKEWEMQDILFIGIALTFFAVCVAYVRGLDRLVRSTEEAEAEIVDLDVAEEVPSR